MAEMDSTRSTVPGARGPEQDPEHGPAAGAGTDAAVRDDQPATGIAQRHDLPRRKAAVMPDLSGVADEDPAPSHPSFHLQPHDQQPVDQQSLDQQPADQQSLDGGAHAADAQTAGASRSDGPSGEDHSDTDRAPARDEGIPTRMMPVVVGAMTATGATAATGSSAAGSSAAGTTAAGTAAGADAQHPGDDGEDSDQGVQAQGSDGEDGDGMYDGGDVEDAETGTSAEHPDRDHVPGDEHPAPVVAPVSSGSHASSGSGSTPASISREPSTDTASLSVRPPDKDAARRAAVRDQAVAAKPVLARFLQVVVALFFPVIVVAAAVRAVATSSFLWLEYHRPGFPADQYGFSLDDRMTYGSYALDYVVNLAPSRYLGGLVTPEGEPLFLESEVGHMADVKGVLGLSFFIALVLFVLSVLACVYLARRYKGGIRRALFAGAVLTLVGIAVLTVLAVLAWETFFTQVHALFFADGTWTFRVDDTLIRLFPEQFWTDSAITIAVLVLGATLLTLILTWPTKARRERSMLAQDAAQARYREALDAS